VSKRHRSPEDAERPAKIERRWSNHRERQAVRASLGAVTDPDDLVVPVLPHDRPHTSAVSTTRKRPRHWKLKEWKRRTTQRRQKVRALQNLAKLP